MPDPFLTAHPGHHTGAMLRARRERAGISVEAIAGEMAGVTAHEIEYWETWHPWTIDRVQLYVAALKRILARRAATP